MGNRALRKQFARELKAAGHHVPLYRGNKRVAWSYYKAPLLRRLLTLLALKPGDVVNDCDGFNHEISSIVGVSIRHFRGCRVLGIDGQYAFTDGTWSCGCPSGPDRA